MKLKFTHTDIQETMKKIIQFFSIFLLTVLSINLFGQESPEGNKMFHLFKSNYKTINVSKDGSLNQVWNIDPKNLLLIKKYLTPINSQLPSPTFDEKLAIKEIEKTFYNPFGGIDSIWEISYNIEYFNDSTKSYNYKNDTTVTYYYISKNHLPLTCKTYSLNNKQQTLIQSDYFSYNPNDQIILIIHNNGEYQSYFEYDKNGLINQIILSGNTNGPIQFKYNKKGKIVERLYISKTFIPNQKIIYSYKNDLLSKRVITGTRASISTYEYK